MDIKKKAKPSFFPPTVEKRETKEMFYINTYIEIDWNTYMHSVESKQLKCIFY